MSKLALQRWLAYHEQTLWNRALLFEKLEQTYGITHKIHKDYPNLVLFKYNMITSPMHEQIVQESRGVILDMHNNWEVVAFPFTKFFNHGEQLAAKIDWSTAKVYEKLDGSLCNVYFYDNKWHVATSGTPDASGEVDGFGFTFAELFWKHFPILELNKLLKTATYMFELTSPYNKIVVQHKEVKITLIGLRNNKTLKEVSGALDSDDFITPVVKCFPLTNLDEVVDSLKDISPTSQEGYVVCDANFNRIKVKSPQYVALHHIKGASGKANLVKIALNGEVDEIIGYFPEFTKELTKYKTNLDNLVKSLENTYKSIESIKDQKTFALEAIKTPCSSALFSLRKGNVTSIREHIVNMNIDRVIELLDK